MKNQLSVSSYSLRQHLGPIRVTRRGPDGTREPVVWGDQPATMTLLDLPAQVKTRLDLNALEICQFHIPERALAYLDRLRSALDAAGVSVINMPIDVGNISDRNEAYREEDLADIEEWMRAAARLGAKMVRVNASGFGQDDLAPLEVTIASYRRLAATAASLGLGLLIENHGGITGDPETIVRIVEGVGRDGIKTLVDVGNFDPVMAASMKAMMSGTEPEEVGDATPLYDAIARVAPYAGLIHAKTLGFHPDGRTKVWDVERALGVVRDSGYAGPISIEFEGTGEPWENTRRSIDLVKRVFA